MKADVHIAFEQLLAYCEKQLSLEEVKSCKKHLDNCEECRNALEAIKTFNSIELRKPHLEYKGTVLNEKLLEITNKYVKQSHEYIGQFYENKNSKLIGASKSRYSDKDIIEGVIAAEDPEIYEYLNEMYREEVIRYVCRNSGTVEDGEELYQDVIYEVYVNIDKGRYNSNNSGTFKQYFWLIVNRRWSDKLRKKGKTSLASKLNELAMQITNKNETEEKTNDVHDDLILAINKQLKLLAKEEQKYIELFFFEKKSLQTIAEYFGTSYEYARLKLHRIREKLRIMIKDDPDYAKENK